MVKFCQHDFAKPEKSLRMEKCTEGFTLPIQEKLYFGKDGIHSFHHIRATLTQYKLLGYGQNLSHSINLWETTTTP